MEAFHKHIGRKVRIQSTKHGLVDGVVLGANKDHIQIRLLKDIRTDTRVWYAGDRKTFDADKVENITLIPDAPKFVPATVDRSYAGAMKIIKSRKKAVAKKVKVDEEE